MSDKTKTTERQEINSLMNINRCYGVEFDFKQPEDLQLRGYFKGFIKVDDYKYPIAELIFVSTDKGPLDKYFSDIEECGTASFYFPFSEKSKKIEDLERTFNEGINDWEKMKEVIDAFRIHTFKDERELMDWLFGFGDEDAPVDFKLDRQAVDAEEED